MSKLSFGIDVTDSEVRIAVLRSSNKGYALEDLRCISRESLKNVKFKKGNTRFSIHDWNAKVKVVLLPNVPKAELEAVVGWAFKESAKVPIDQLVLRFLPQGQPGPEKNPYLVFGLERKRIQERVIELKKLGVQDLCELEPDTLALANCITYNYQELENKVVGFVWVEALGAMCGVLGDEGLLYQRLFSGIRLIDSGDNSSILSKISVEVQYSCENFVEQFPKRKPEKIFLVGDSARMAGLMESVAEATGVPVEFLNPFKSIDVSSKQTPELEGDLSRFAVAIGLAL